MRMGAAIEHSSTALLKVNLGQLPGRIASPPGHVVVAVDGMERAGFEYEAFKAGKSALLDHIHWYDGPTLAEALGV